MVQPFAASYTPLLEEGILRSPCLFRNVAIDRQGSLTAKLAMPKRTSQTGSELFIVDNSDDEWKVVKYLHDWCGLSKAIDIATGYFEIGSLLSLDDEWQKVDQLRILMGDEISQRTRRAFEQGLAEVVARLDKSLEDEKEKNDFLVGVPAIVEAIRSGYIQCRVYRKDKFHAKCYLTHARQEVVGSFGLVGSSNFTFPGINQNIELNVQITGTPVTVLQEWYEQHWMDAEDVSPELLRVIERHIREYTPFEAYAKALQEFFKGHELTAGEWELAGPANGGSRMYPVLDQYQKEGYQALLKISRQHGGAFLCDGVGLGKTFVGLMLIERFAVHERKNVVLFVPKSGREPVWEAALRQYLPRLGGTFSGLQIYNHTDLQRGGRFEEEFENVKERADVVIIDEAHHFRNPGPKGEDAVGKSRYRRMFDLTEGPNGVKQMFMLTATPVNNRLIDLQHMIELFSRRQPPASRGVAASRSCHCRSPSLAAASPRGSRCAAQTRFPRVLRGCPPGDAPLWTIASTTATVARPIPIIHPKPTAWPSWHSLIERPPCGKTIRLYQAASTINISFVRRSKTHQQDAASA